MKKNKKKSAKRGGGGYCSEKCYMYYGRGRRENVFALKFLRLWPVALLEKADWKQGTEVGSGKV
jgi:hypothetical protein